MKKLFSIIIPLLLNQYSVSQERFFKIDTILVSKDSTVVYVQEFIDTVLLQSYYGVISDSLDSEFRYGFLKLKKGIIREYKIEKTMDLKKYDLSSFYPGYRGSGLEPVIFKRIE